MSLKVSVVTVCFNEADTIARTVDSVLSQSHSNIQYVVIDGSSTDGTSEILRDYAQRIDTLVVEPDDGLYFAMNKAVRLAEGDIVYFLNADDHFFDSEVVTSAVQRFEGDHGLDILSGRIAYFNAPLVDGMPYRRTRFDFANKLELYKRPNSQQCIFVRAELFNTVGIFNTAYRLCADYEWLIRAINMNCRLQFVNQCFAHVDYTGISWTENALRKREKRRIILRHSSPTELIRFAAAGAKQLASRFLHG